MKLIILLFHRLQGHFTENKFISVIYILGFMVSVLAFTFIYNNFMPHVVKLALDDANEHYYSFTFSEEVEDISWLRKLLKNYDTYYVTYSYSIFEGEEIEPGLYYSHTNSSDVANDPLALKNTLNSIIAYKDDSIPDEQGPKFTQEEREGDSYVAILPANNLGLAALSEYMYEEHLYKVVGRHNGSRGMIIPEEFYEKQGFPVDQITIYTSDILSTKEQRRLILSICEKYNVSKLHSPQSAGDIYNEYKENTRPILFMLITGFMVMIFVFGYLIRYLVTAGKSEILICRLTGAGNIKIAVLTLLESLIINLILAVLALAVHAVLFDLVFSRLNFYNVRLNIYDYLFIAGITVLFSFAAVLPHIIQSVKFTLINIRNRI